MWFGAQLPVALRVVHAGVLVALGACLVGVATNDESPWFFVWLPLTFGILGVMLLFDVAGSATAHRAAARSRKPPGVDDSAWVFGSPWFAWVFGALAILIACGMGVAVVQQLS